MAYPGRIINDLPSEVIEEILCRLPIRDAVRTSVLSRIWRYKWISMPSLNFEAESSCLSDHKELVELIDKCFRLLKGPIRKFSLRHCMILSPYIDRWMSRLSRHHPVEELQFRIPNKYFRFPKHLFNCKKLTHLELYNCKLVIPRKFKGFLNLKTLALEYVEVTGNIEMIVSTSPLLESLTLLMPRTEVQVITISAPKLNYLDLQLSWHNGQVVTISAPKLNCLKLDVHPKFKYIFLKNVMPDGVMNDIDQRDCNLIKLLPHGTGYFNNQMGAPQTTTFHHLKVVKLSSLNFQDGEEVLHLLEMLTSAPNLEQLFIQPRDAPPGGVASDFWRKEHPLQGREFMNLKVFEMKTSGVPDEIEFAKFILCNSPVLRKIVMSCTVWNRTTVNDVHSLRACTRAAFKLKFYSADRLGLAG